MPDEVLVSPAELFGDGVFETVHLRPTGPWLLEAHLSRLARSAALLDLPSSLLDLPSAPLDLPSAPLDLPSAPLDLPSAPLDLPSAPLDLPSAPLDLTGLVSDGPESALRIIRTRRSQHVTVSPIPAEMLRERESGIRAISAGLGVAIGGRPPWSLWPAKTLSYASNFAARRWARERGADDLLWLSTEGYALESPTASLIWLAGSELCTVPPEEAQILTGTTAAHLLSVAPSVGLRPVHRLVTIEELRAADAIWLASALRGLAFVKSLDGEPRRTSRWTPILQDLLGYPRSW